jgi:hypothetical protein
VSQPLIVSLPPNLDLRGGSIIRVTAVSPTTGASMSGVQVGNITLEVDDLKGSNLDFGPFMLVTGPSG